MGNPERFRAVAERISKQVAGGWTRIAVVVSAMSGETNRLVSLMKQVNASAPANCYDMAVAAGEQVSVGLLAASLESFGVRAEPLLGYQLGVITDRDHSRARIESIQTEKIEAAWRAGKIPVVAGFQGVTSDLSLTTLGRGGSDTSAVALAAALKASFCEINTDVSGVFTADPRVVPDALLIERLDYDTAMELALLGGKVLHVRCVELAAKYKMPLVVRSTFDKDQAKRTFIMQYSDKEKLEAPVVSGVSLERNVAKIAVRKLDSSKVGIPAIFAHLAKEGVNVDIIVHDRSELTGELQVAFSVVESETTPALTALKGLAQDHKTIEVEPKVGLAKVSVVGLGMQTHSGVASRAFEALAQSKIDILMISTSEIKISCVVPATQADEAVRCLHTEFFG